MKETRDIMGMPITVEIAENANKQDFEDVFAYFVSVDNQFSTYKLSSEITRINRGEIPIENCSSEMREVFALAESTKRDTLGYFDIKMPTGSLDPSGIVKGWSIKNAAALLKSRGYKNFYIDAGGDVQSYGVDETGEAWRVGIRNPFNRDEHVKVLRPKGAGVATSGTYARGQHIYNPKKPGMPIHDIVSITVIAPDVMEADCFATAAFAMGKDGIYFIESLPDCEGYQIDSQGVATMTTNFINYTTT